MDFPAPGDHLLGSYPMKRVFPFLAALVLVCFAGGPARAREPLVFGFLPIFSPATLAKLHTPLKDHLEKDLGVPVRMVSAPGFKEFIDRSGGGRYDLIFTAPHLARLAEKKNRYRRVAATAHRGRATFLAAKESRIGSIDDLKGRSLALPPQSAIIHHMALRTLRERGLEPDRDVRIVTTKSHNDPILRLLAGRVLAAAVGKAPWARMKDKAGDRLAVVGYSVTIPGFMILAAPTIEPQRLDSIRKAFFRFNETASGRKYLQESGYERLVSISDRDMKDMDGYLERMFNR